MAWNMRILPGKCLRKNFKHGLKLLQNSLHDRPAVILGIESSCDETGCGIVDSTGKILGEALNSQHLIHLNYGGIIPPIARRIHTDNITKVCESALKSANLRLKDIDAVAATVKPGLIVTLDVGTRFGKYLAKVGNKPFIPIHHMEAHALTARMSNQVCSMILMDRGHLFPTTFIAFPYLALLVSGGHCLLVIVESASKFYLLGSTIDIAPGDALDKIARRLKLKNISEFSALSGGLAIETAACKASHADQFTFASAMIRYRSCNFSFAGLVSGCMNRITQEEKKHDIIADMLIPDVYNMCASIQLAIVTHICQRTQRAIEFINKMSLFPEDKRTLVVSGGVGSNNLLAKSLGIMCSEFAYNFVRTPPKLCTDNGVMIAWNGVEKWDTNTDVIRDLTEIEKVHIQGKAPFGEDWRGKVKEANLKCKWVEINRNLF